MGRWILAQEIEDLLGLGPISHGFGPHGLCEFLLGHLDIVDPSDLGEDQAQAHPALGDLAVLDLKLGIGLVRVLGWQAASRLVLLDLFPNLGELGLDHTGWEEEVVPLVEDIEQGPLQLEACGTRKLRLQVGAEQFLELLKVLDAQALGQRVVHLARHRSPDFLDLDGELGVLSGELSGLILGGEGHLDQDLVSRLGADELLLETGNELAGAEGQGGVFRPAALEGLAVHPAKEVNQELVAILGLDRLSLARLVGLAGLRQLGQSLADFFFSRLIDGALERDFREVGRFELGDHFQSNLVRQV